MKIILVNEQKVGFVAGTKLQVDQNKGNCLDITLKCDMVGEKMVTRPSNISSNQQPQIGNVYGSGDALSGLNNYFVNNTIEQAETGEKLKVELSLTLNDVFRWNFKYGQVLGSLKVKVKQPWGILSKLVEGGASASANPTIQVKVTMEGGQVSMFEFPTNKLQEAKVEVQQEGNGIPQEDICYEAKKITLPATLMKSPLPDKVEASITIAVWIPEKPEPVNQDSPWKKMLEEKKYTDATLVAQNGKIIEAHKFILMGKSSVLDAMLQNSDQVEVPEMSELVVNYLLRYLYYGDRYAPVSCSRIAFELFCAGKRYKIEELEQDMRRLLLDAPSRYICIEVAISMFASALKQEPMDLELKQRAIDKLQKAQQNIVMKSMEFNKLFETDPETAKELMLSLKKIFKIN